MSVAFLIIFVLTSELIYSVAAQQNSGFNPYPFGVSVFSKILHALLLGLCTLYLGWLFGTILFACHMFGIIHATVGWVLLIPSLLIRNNSYTILKLMQFELNMLFPMLIIVFTFWIVSIFIAPFGALKDYIASNPTILVVPGIIIAVCFVLRFFVFDYLNRDHV